MSQSIDYRTQGVTQSNQKESHHAAHEYRLAAEALAFDGISVESSHAGLRLSTVHNGRRVSRLYQGYTLPECADSFAAELAATVA